jgi:hypothetical protein
MKQYHRGDALVRDFDGLVHPSQVFQHPSEVVGDPDLSSLWDRRTLFAGSVGKCGRTAGRQILRHLQHGWRRQDTDPEVEESSVPSWRGTTQTGMVKYVGDHLGWTNSVPLVASPDFVATELTWARAK